MKKTLILIVVGGVLGGAGVFYGQVPAMRALGMEGREVEAIVVEERQEEGGRLVLVLQADDDTFLASFRQRADDVASLVSVGDRLTMRTPRDGVFADDAPILRVQRSEVPEFDERVAANVPEVVEVGVDGVMPALESGEESAGGLDGVSGEAPDGSTEGPDPLNAPPSPSPEAELATPGSALAES